MPSAANHPIDPLDDPWLDLAVDAEARRAAAEEQLERALGAIERGRRPVAVGPWHSEVGFEALYWIPFLRRLVAEHDVDPARLIAVSRGGVAAWYEGVCGRYRDIFDVVDNTRYRRATSGQWSRLGGQKQGTVTAWDRSLLRSTGAWPRWARRPPVLHPSIVYGLFRRFWKGGQPLREVLGRLRYERWPLPRDESIERALPDEDYVAVRFYFRDSFPDDAENRRLARRAVEALAERLPVVLLNVGTQFDDHLEYDPGLGDRVLQPLRGAPASRNLHAQSVALANARAFVGTYGGLSYVAAAYGVNGVSVASAPERVFPTHLDLARRAAAATGAAFDLVDTAALGPLARIAPLLEASAA